MIENYIIFRDLLSLDAIIIISVVLFWLAPKGIDKLVASVIVLICCISVVYYGVLLGITTFIVAGGSFIFTYWIKNEIGGEKK